MRKATILLNIIRERAKRGLPVRDIYRTLYQRDLYLLAYSKLYKNEGAMTEGTTRETVDGLSLSKIDALIESIRFERFRWTPVRRVYIPKKNGKTRPLGLPVFSDKLVQEVIRLILEAYYEPRFSDSSHGFRPGRGCHTALQVITQKGHGTKWFIEGDIKGCFDRIDHTILLTTLQKDFPDNRFQTLMKRLLQAGYVENWKYHQTHSGVPQGSIIGPILSNLVLDKLDKFIKETLIPSFHQGERRTMNPVYAKLTRDASKARKGGDLRRAKMLNRQAQQLPSRLPNDPTFKRVWYVRYADDWLVGVIGTKADAVSIKTCIAQYLQDELHLELSGEKTLITHARNEKASFLGYEIHGLHCDTKHTDGQRSINGSIGLRVPEQVIRTAMSPYMKTNKPIHRMERVKDAPYSIVLQYQLEYVGLVQYYRMAYNLHVLSKLRYTMEVSLVKTLAHKYKTTCTKIYRKYGATLTNADGRYKVLQVIVNRPDRAPLETHFGGVALKWNKWAQVDENRDSKIWSKRSEVIERLLADKCELCGQEGSVEMHHVRKLADIENKHGKEIPCWKREMAMRRRKSLAVCASCHQKIHRGDYDGRSVRKSTGEPRDQETIMRGSERGGWKSN